MIGLLLQIFWVFFVIGLFTFGGGYAIISIIQSEVVTARGWIPESTFTDIVAISQMTPGPVGLNCSTSVGYEVLRNAGAGEAFAIFGSFAASVAIVLPSFLIMLAIVRFYTKFHENSIFKGVMGTLRPAVAGLIGAAALQLMFSLDPGADAGEKIRVVQENFPDAKSWWLFAAAFAASFHFKLDPLVILAAGGVLGVLLY